MKLKIFSFVFVFMLLFVGISLSSEEEGFSEVPKVTNVTVSAILASTDDPFVSPELEEFSQELNSVFAFKGFKLEQVYGVTFKTGEIDRVIMPYEDDIVLELKDYDNEGKAVFLLTIKGKLKTTFSIMNNGHLVIGGPKYDRKTLILLIKAEY